MGMEHLNEMKRNRFYCIFFNLGLSPPIDMDTILLNPIHKRVALRSDVKVFEI